MKRSLTDRDLQSLRERNVLLADETAYWVGDKLIAENVLTQERRIIPSSPDLMLESKKGLLKG